MVMISQCNTPNNRIAYVEQLMREIDVDSFGKCAHNADFDADLLTLRNKYAQKSAVMRRYWFYLAFEVRAVCVVLFVVQRVRHRIQTNLITCRRKSTMHWQKALCPVSCFCDVELLKKTHCKCTWAHPT